MTNVSLKVHIPKSASVMNYPTPDYLPCLELLLHLLFFEIFYAENNFQSLIILGRLAKFFVIFFTEMEIFVFKYSRILILLFMFLYV